MVQELINAPVEEITNTERYLKYILISPGLGADYQKSINGAMELGLNARVVIRLLEQPEESFNKEVIEEYVSQAHKAGVLGFWGPHKCLHLWGVAGRQWRPSATPAAVLRVTERSGRRRDWAVYADDGTGAQKMQLVPYEKLQTLYQKFAEVCAVLDKEFDPTLPVDVVNNGATADVTSDNAETDVADESDDAVADMLQSADSCNDDSAVIV